jgi:ATP-dependent helicase HrpA
VKRDYFDPHWDARSGHVRGFEKVTLFGLPIVPRRGIHYGPIDPVASRGIFIQHALVQGEMSTQAPFFLHNAQLLAHARLLEAKARRRDLLVDQQQIYAFFDARVPEGIHNVPLFEQWRRQAELKDPKLLFLPRDAVMRPEAAVVTLDRYPDQIVIDDLRLALTYSFEPGDDEDGVTLTLPLPAVNQVPAARFEWLVPGHLPEKVELLIRSLPRQLRTVFVPIPDTAAAAVREMPIGAGSLLDALAAYLSSWGKAVVRRYDFDPDSLPEHLRMNFRVVDAHGKALARGRDLSEIRRKLGVRVKEAFEQLPPGQFHRQGITHWDFGDLPERVPVPRHGMTVWGYPALVDNGENVSINLLDSPEVARQAMRKGITRLFAIELQKEIEYLSRNIPCFDQMALWYKPVADADQLRHEIMTVVADRALMPDGHDIRTQRDFAELAESGWRRLTRAGDEVFPLVERILSQYHAVALALSRAFPPLLQPAVVEMRCHLATLVYRGFLIHTPYDWLIHLPRFLKGIDVRLTKLQSAGLDRDRRAAAQLQPLQDRYDERLLLHTRRDLRDPAMATYFWMLQELRVSLFAQELKTSIPISPQRLDKQWDKTRPE